MSLRLVDVPPSGKEILVTLSGNVEVDVYPKTEVTALIKALQRDGETARTLAAKLGIEPLDVYRLKGGSKSCAVKELKHLLGGDHG